MVETKIICEIASCHNGDLELAKALIYAAAKNGADMVKFQDWRASNVPDSDTDKKRYEKYQFKEEWYPELIEFCKQNNVEFLTSCFNADRAKLLASLGIKKIKTASISLTNTELLMSVGLNFEEVIASTAMHDKQEVEDAIELLVSNAQKFTIMHCVANYPTLPQDANLQRINQLRRMTEDYECASVGYSDHSLDLDVAKTAIAMGVKYIEKHFSLSRFLPQTPHQMFEGGPMVTTHQVSIEPHELKELSEWRDKVAVIHGSGEFTINEIESKIKARYSNRYGK